MAISIQLGGYTVIVQEDFSWTVIPPLTSGDREIYVANAPVGVDAGVYDASHGTILAPFATIAYAKAFVRHLSGDRLFLNANQTHTGNFDLWTASGLSTSRPIIITRYGVGANPRIDTGTSYGIQPAYQFPISYFWMVSLEITSLSYAGNIAFAATGLKFAWYGSNILIEDCYVHNYGLGLYLIGSNDGNNLPFGRIVDIRIRGCTFADCYIDIDPAINNNPGAHGCLAGNIDTLYFENTAFIDCGWKSSNPFYGTDRKHSLYIHAGGIGHTPLDNRGCTDVHVLDCMCVGADGMTVRPGGEVRRCVGVRGLSGLQAGTGDNAQVTGIQLNMEDNVIIEGQSFSPSVGTFAYSLGNIGHPSTFKRNLAANPRAPISTQDVRSVWFRSPDHSADSDVDFYNMVINSTLDLSDNILYHYGYFVPQSDASAYAGGVITMTNNDIHLDDALGGPESCRFNQAGVISAFVGTGNNWYQNGAYETGPNAHKWYYRAGAPLTNISVFASDIGDASFTTVQRPYPDPTRNLASYYASIGGAADHDTFVAAFRTRSKNGTFYNIRNIRDHIAAGWGL